MTILAQCPQSIPQEDYVKSIAPQVINLFFSIDPRYARHFFRVAGSVYSMFAQRFTQLTRTHFTEPVLAPFAAKASLYAKEFRVALSHIHLVFVSSTEPCWQTLSQLSARIIYLLFDAYALLKSKYFGRETRG